MDLILQIYEMSFKITMFQMKKIPFLLNNASEPL